jgi:hypothetical protein
MKFKLKKDAPWEEVTANSGKKIDKVNWVSNVDILPFLKYIDFFLEETDNGKDYTLDELIEIANKNDVYPYNLTKEHLLFKLKDVKIEKKYKTDFSKFSKQELVNFLFEKNIPTDKKSKAELVELCLKNS